MVNSEKERYEEALSLVNQISGTILEQREQQDVLNEIIERVAQTFNARAGSIAVPDEDEEYLEFIAGFNREPDVLKRLNTTHQLRVNEGVAGRAYTHQEICAVPNIYDDELFQDKFYHQAEEEGIRALYSVPLMAFGDCVGVVTFYYGNVTKFDETLQKIMKLVANQIALAMLQANQIENLEESNIRLKRKAETDGLTGLPNHQKIQGILRREVKRANRYEHPLSLMMIDIDHFKKVNDTYGHPFGDQVLQILAERFLQQTRDVDAVGRYGGEEFMFVLPETAEEMADTLAERLRRTVEETDVTHGEEHIDTTISIGITSRNSEKESADTLIDRADTALLYAKQSGRNKVVRYSEIPNSWDEPTTPPEPAFV